MDRKEKLKSLSSDALLIRLNPDFFKTNNPNPSYIENKDYRINGHCDNVLDFYFLGFNVYLCHGKSKVAGKIDQSKHHHCSSDDDCTLNMGTMRR